MTFGGPLNASSIATGTTSAANVAMDTSTPACKVLIQSKMARFRMKDKGDGLRSYCEFYRPSKPLLDVGRITPLVWIPLRRLPSPAQSPRSRICPEELMFDLKDVPETARVMMTLPFRSPPPQGYESDRTQQRKTERQERDPRDTDRDERAPRRSRACEPSFPGATRYYER